MIILGLTLAPIFAIIFFVYLKDEYDKEPMKHLVISFLLGCISVIPAMVLEYSAAVAYPDDPTNLMNTAIWAFIIIAGSEELSKFIMLRFYAFRQKEFDEPYDGIVYGVIVSLGFAAIENVMYVYSGGGGLSVALLRMFTAVPAHASFGVIMGYYVGLAWQHKDQSFQYLTRGLLVAILLHGVYDFFLIQQNFPAFALFSFIGLFISVRLALKAIKTHQQNSPFRPDRLENDN